MYGYAAGTSAIKYQPAPNVNVSLAGLSAQSTGMTSLDRRTSPQASWSSSYSRVSVKRQQQKLQKKTCFTEVLCIKCS